MKWRVVFARPAGKELSKLPTQVQIRVARSVRSLEKDFFPPGARRLKGREEFRIRGGDYRVLNIVEHNSRCSIISAIDVKFRQNFFTP